MEQKYWMVITDNLLGRIISIKAFLGISLFRIKAKYYL
jgi:hypothetical protein